MRKLLLALALLFAPNLAWGQCNGVFVPNTVCGSNAGGVPGQINSITIGGVTISPTPNSNAQGLVVQQSYSGSTLFPFIGPVNMARTGNGINVSSDDAAPPNNGFIDDFAVTHVFGGPATLGGRNAIFSWIQQTAATSAANTNPNYVAFQGIGDSQSGDGGTNTGAGAKGAVFGAGLQCRLGISAINMLACAGLEIDILGTASSSSKYIFGNSIVSQHIVQGASLDTAIAIYSSIAQGSYGPGVGFHNGITFAEVSGTGGVPPVDSGATLIGTHFETLSSFSAANGIDFSKFVFSGKSINVPGFGVATTGLVGVGSQTSTIALDINANANAASASAPAAGSQLRVVGADATNNIVAFDSFGQTTTLQARRADGTAASRTGLVNTDLIFSITAAGWTSGAAYSATSASIRYEATETWSNSATGSQIKHRATKNGTTTLADVQVVDGVGHIQQGSIAPASVSTCGTGSIVANSTDASGQVIATGATVCTLNFANAYTSVPNCVATDNTTAAGLKVVPATGNITVSGLTSGDTFTYICFAKVGG